MVSLGTTIDNLDFADDLALLSHTQQQMQDKTDTVSYNSTRIGFHIYPTKTKVLRINATNTNQVILGGEDLEVESFTYLGSNVDKSGGTDADVRVRIGKSKGSLLLAEEYLAFINHISQIKDKDLQHNC